MMRIVRARKYDATGSRMKIILITAALVVTASGISGCAILRDAGSDDPYYHESDMHEMMRKTGGAQSLDAI
jgi:hypothetical protein